MSNLNADGYEVNAQGVVYCDCMKMWDPCNFCKHNCPKCFAKMHTATVFPSRCNHGEENQCDGSSGFIPCDCGRVFPKATDYEDAKRRCNENNTKFAKKFKEKHAKVKLEVI